jgi:hypothetical protein
MIENKQTLDGETKVVRASPREDQQGVLDHSSSFMLTDEPSNASSSEVRNPPTTSLEQ